MPRETDYIQQLVNYIKKNLSKGYTIESLKWALINQGHSRSEVQRAIDLTNKQLADSAPKLIEKPVIKYEIINEEKEDKKEKTQTNEPNEREKNYLFYKEKKTFWKRLKKILNK